MSEGSSSGGFLTQLVDSIVQFPGEFVDVAMHDPLSAVLIAFGALFVTAASAVFGYLAAGAALSVFTIDSSGGPPQQAG